MVKVYIVSKFKEDDEKKQEFNKSVARYFARNILASGKIPVVPHLYYTQFLDDNCPDEREYGLRLGIKELRDSQEFLLVVIDGVISEGMKEEIAEISRLGMKGRIVSMTHQEIKEAMKVVR